MLIHREPATFEAVKAAASVIKAAGYDAMARQFLDEPEKRERILTAMIRNISRDNPEAGARFSRAVNLLQF